MKAYNVTQVIRVGPKKVAKAGGKYAVIYLPKSLVWLQGKTVQVTIEVLDFSEDSDGGKNAA